MISWNLASIELDSLKRWIDTWSNTQSNTAILLTYESQLGNDTAIEMNALSSPFLSIPNYSPNKQQNYQRANASRNTNYQSDNRSGCRINRSKIDIDNSYYRGLMDLLGKDASWEMLILNVDAKMDGNYHDRDGISLGTRGVTLWIEGSWFSDVCMSDCRNVRSKQLWL